MSEKLVISQEESPEDRRRRFSEGRMREEEIQGHWAHPDEPLFDHHLAGREGKEGAEIKVRALTEEYADKLLESVRGSWGYEGDVDLLQGTMERFFRQRALSHPGIVNVEYYIATDTADQPLAITGIYTSDMEGGAGFGTRDRLDPARHNLNTGLGWFAVSPEHQGGGIGGFLFDWTERMAQERGARFHCIETDDSPNEQAALRLYERKGYKKGLNVDNFYGPGRHRRVYYAYKPEGERGESSVPHEQISPDNKEEVLAMGQRRYGPERYEEFKVAVDLLLQQTEEENDLVRKPTSFVMRDANGAMQGFAILGKSLYNNGTICFWYGAQDDRKRELFSAIEGYTAGLDRDVTMLHHEGDDADAAAYGFRSPEADEGIPYIFEKEDETQYLFYTKDFRPADAS